MRKAIAIFFLFTFMASTAHLYELVKLPEFVGHFVEHKKEDASISFWQFISIHYFKGNVQDADYAKDMKLPFKTLDHTSTIVVLDVPVRVFNLKTNTIYTKKSFTKTDPHFYNSSYSAAIWQPPKA